MTSDRLWAREEWDAIGMGLIERIKEIEAVRARALRRGARGGVGPTRCTAQEMARTQKNKATEHHLGMLKAKLAKLRTQLMEGPKVRVRRGRAGGGHSSAWRSQVRVRIGVRARRAPARAARALT
jgi:hypothetical protein